MKYTVELLTREQLPEELQDEYGFLDTYDRRQVLVIKHEGKIIASQLDGGEPEDQLFCRDWSWVAPALLDAYKRGVEDGRQK